jgi:predicted outer membrane protein
MARHAKLFSLVVGFVLVLLVVGPAPAQQAPLVATPRPPEWSAAGEKRAEDATAMASDVVSLVHYGNDVAADLGHLAARNGGSRYVRRLGALMVADAARADRQLFDYARRRAGVTIEATSLAGDDRPEMQRKMAAMQRLRSLGGDAFDHEFLALVTGDRARALSDMVSYRQMIADPDLRALLSRAAPIVQQQLAIASALLGRRVGS